MSSCHHAVTGHLIVHNGLIPVADRQKPPLAIAPSAGHVDPEDGLDLSGDLRMDIDDPAFRRSAAREISEELGLNILPDELTLALTYAATDACAKQSAHGGPGGSHLWRVYTFQWPYSAAPKLSDEPGKMHNWRWAAPSELVRDPGLEPIWGTLLQKILERPVAGLVLA